MDQDPDGALHDFENARQCNPRSPEALQNIAHIHAEIKMDPGAAIAVLESYLRDCDANSPMALAGLGVLQARQGNTEAAVESLEAALARSRSAETCYQAACGFARLADRDAGQVDRAVALLRECFRQDLSWAHSAVEDPDLAGLQEHQEFRRALAAATILHTN